MRSAVTGHTDPLTELPEIDTPAAARALEPDQYYRVLTSRNTGIVSEADQQSVAKARILIAGIAKILPHVDLEGTRLRNQTTDSRTRELVH